MRSASIQHSRFSRSLRKENEPSSHTKAHVAYYAEQNRLRLFGLTRLASKGFRERFEKRNLDALRLGYAQGLKQYRVLLYQHVTASVLKEKKRDYFTPEEIDAIQSHAGK
jgi:hypothetical protein